MVTRRVNFSREASFGDLYDPAMEIKDQDEADAYFSDLVDRHITIFGSTKESAEYTERVNLGYWAGYYDWDTRVRIKKLFDASHPIFGDKNPTPEEAFEMGKKWALKNK